MSSPPTAEVILYHQHEKNYILVNLKLLNYLFPNYLINFYLFNDLTMQACTYIRKTLYIAFYIVSNVIQ